MGLLPILRNLRNSRRYRSFCFKEFYRIRVLNLREKRNEFLTEKWLFDFGIMIRRIGGGQYLTFSNKILGFGELDSIQSFRTAKLNGKAELSQKIVWNPGYHTPCVYFKTLGMNVLYCVISYIRYSTTTFPRK